MPTLVLKACDCAFTVECTDDETAALLDAVFGALVIPCRLAGTTVATPYRIERGGWSGYCISDPDGGTTTVADADGLLFHFDKWLTIALQRQRPDLYFLHAAAVAKGNRVAVLAAPAGTGKSTLTLALLGSGFAYLSDELAPIDLPSRHVYRYAHAVSLKSAPPDPVRLPREAVAVGPRFHVPSRLFSAGPMNDPLPLAAFVFLRGRLASGPLSRRIGAAAAAAYIVANALNGLAHQSDGLKAAVTLAESVPCFEMNASDLPAACGEVAAILAAPL